MAKIKERLKAPVPKLVKKIQYISGTIGALGAIVTGAMTQYPNLHVPAWVPEAIAAAALVHHLILQLTTRKDFAE